VKIAGNVTGGRHRKFAMASREMTDAEFLGFNGTWMVTVLPYLCDGGILGTFIDRRGLPTVHSAAVNLGFVIRAPRRSAPTPGEVSKIIRPSN